MGEDIYSILLFGGEHKFFTNTHMDIWSRPQLKKLSKENRFTADIKLGVGDLDK